MGKMIDLTGQRFGRLTVVKRADDYVFPNEEHRPKWLCKCDCGNKVEIVGKYLTKKNGTKSCGCLTREAVSQAHKKFNTYDLSGEYGIGYTSNTNEPFLFDKEDYEKIKNYSWIKSNKGYVVTTITIDKNKTKTISFHRLVTNAPDDVLVDHIKHNKLDNRKSELRLVDSVKNEQNSKLAKNNTSGITGVTWHSRDRVWQARIKVNYKYIHLGYFDNIEDAVKARKQAEEKYFGEYSYDNSMKKGVA